MGQTAVSKAGERNRHIQGVTASWADRQAETTAENNAGEGKPDL